MAHSILFVSLLIAFCSLYSTTHASSIRTSSSPVTQLKNHNSHSVIDEEIPLRNHFADFLRALYAPEMRKDGVALPLEAENDTPNEIFPLISPDEEQNIHGDEEDQRKEFPVDGVILPILQKRNSRYCGSYLADALQLACSSSSFLPLFGKRSSVPASTTLAAPKVEAGSWPFISSEKAKSMLSNQHLFHRYTRGVHDECCVKGCSFKELTSYCTAGY